MTTIEKKPLLQVIGLSTHFLSFGGKRVVKAVDQVSFEAYDGDRVAHRGFAFIGKDDLQKDCRIVYPRSRLVVSVPRIENR